MDQIRCGLKKGVLEVFVCGEDQCPTVGPHRHRKWPLVPMCCWHYQELSELVDDIDAQVAENMHRWLAEENEKRKRKVLGTA